MIRILLGVLLAAIIALVALGVVADTWRKNAAAAEKRAESAEAIADTLVEVIDAEREKARQMAEIGTQLEEARTDAETVPAAIAADLRSGNLVLRKEWAACETRLLSGAVAGTIERDALAADRAALAGEIVRIGRDADDQLRACQAVILADRSKP